MDWRDFPGHDLVFETKRLLLRPFRQSDFDVALGYYADPELRAALEGDPDAAVSIEYLREAGLYLSSWGRLFALQLKLDRRTIGEACLERMNLDRGRTSSEERVFRVPIAIWDRRLWGQGLGGEVLDCMLERAFGVEDAERVCAMDVKRDNARSRRLFESRGFVVARELLDAGVIDLELSREAYIRHGGRRA